MWFIDSGNLCFIFILKEKINKGLSFNIVYFPNFEISASLQLAPPSNKHRTSQFQNTVEEIRYKKC